MRMAITISSKSDYILELPNIPAFHYSIIPATDNILEKLNF
jgi:hypothetical protein